ncbi:hypothetical protein EGW08_015948 [Elysia chlorotica]|uniref:Uncharacterized protein n=1 Tax=Elysia chlorotica TaxID=188477 RepID=A0A433T438_ELYCH|nr:hypothetical protein EGW08_015948 [Elysia chlorotica]
MFMSARGLQPATAARRDRQAAVAPDAPHASETSPRLPVSPAAATPTVTGKSAPREPWSISRSRSKSGDNRSVQTSVAETRLSQRRDFSPDHNKRFSDSDSSSLESASAEFDGDIFYSRTVRPRGKHRSQFSAVISDFSFQG